MSSHAVQDVLHGWACPGKEAKVVRMDLPLKTFTEDDVEINITHCGICGSDIHTMDSGWGKTDYPCVVGHEIAGVVARVGSNVKHIKVGDNAGVGAQSGSCLQCEHCKNGNENICTSGFIGTYNSLWPDGTKTMGGYADRWRGHGHFVFKIPDGMSNETAATMFCAGVTVYSPLKRYGVGKGSRVGVLGLGGLGHYAVMWASAMGADDVYVISRNDAKKKDAEALGATTFIDSSRPPDELAQFKDSMTHIICTSFSDNLDWDFYFRLLKPNGHFIMVALAESRLAGIRPNLLAMRQINVTGSNIGSPAMIRDMLQFAQDKGIKPWLTKFRMDDVNSAIEAQRNNEGRYRIILEN